MAGFNRSMIISIGLIGFFNDRPPADHQAAAISRRAAPARPFRQGRRGLLRHPVDAVGRPARARDAARRHPGRAHPPRRPLHAAGQKIADKAVRVLRECEELADMARAEGQPLHGELRMGVIPTIAPFLLPAMLPRLREQWPSLKLYLREETSQAACDALHRGQLDCVLLALPFACGDVDSAPCSTTAVRRLPARRGAARRDRSSRRDRREPAAAARGRPLPQGPCAVRLQPARAARRGGDDGHLAPHAGADGRQRPRPDLRPGDGDRGRHPRRHRGRRPAAALDHGFRRIALIWRRSSPREERVSAARRSAAPDRRRGHSPIGVPRSA
jgi:LysR family hydrogen peroxide-inducible transcriptional activator